MIWFDTGPGVIGDFERISGWKDANRRLLQELSDTSSAGPLGRAVAAGTLQLRDLTAGASPVDTGTLQSAHRGRIEPAGGEVAGIVYIDPYVTNPVSGTHPEFYGELWAMWNVNWFERIADAHGESVLDQMEQTVIDLFTQAWEAA